MANIFDTVFDEEDEAVVEAAAEQEEEVAEAITESFNPGESHYKDIWGNSYVAIDSTKVVESAVRSIKNQPTDIEIEDSDLALGCMCACKDGLSDPKFV